MLPATADCFGVLDVVVVAAAWGPGGGVAAEEGFEGWDAGGDYANIKLEAEGEMMG